MVHPADREVAVAQARRDTRAEQSRQHDTGINSDMKLSLDDMDRPFTIGARPPGSGVLLDCDDAHYFSFPTTASIFAFKTGIVKGLAITLLAPNFVARSISSLSLFPVNRIKPIFCVGG